MAKFCTKCGKELKNGEICDCTKEKNEVVKSDKLEVAKTPKEENKFNDMFQELLNVFKKFIKKPLDTVEENNKESNFNNALILIGLYAISGAIFALTFIKNAIETTMSAFAPSGFGQLMNQAQANIEIPYFKIFVYVVLGMAATTFVASLITYLISNKMLNGKTTYKETVVMYAFPTIAGTLIFLIAAIFNYINVKLAVLTFSIGIAFVQYYLNVSSTKKLDINKNNVGHVIITSSIITSVIICYVVSKLVK